MTNQNARPAVQTTRPQPTSGVASFDCYRLAVEFAALAASLVPRGHASLRDQLERASTSVALNLAEAFGRWQVATKFTSTRLLGGVSLSRELRLISFKLADWLVKRSVFGLGCSALVSGRCSTGSSERWNVGRGAAHWPGDGCGLRLVGQLANASPGG